MLPYTLYTVNRYNVSLVACKTDEMRQNVAFGTTMILVYKQPLGAQYIS